MNAVDVAIVLFVLASLVRGYRIGLVRQTGSTLGFVAGLFAGSFIASHVIDQVAAQNRSLIGLLIVLGSSLLVMTAGEYLGVRLKTKIMMNRQIDSIDGGLGSVMGAATVLLAIWLAGALLLLGPTSGFQQQVKESRIISQLNRNLPSAGQVLGTLNKLIDPNGFPQVFSGLEPSPNTANKLPSLGSFDSVIAASRDSVVKLEGSGCGGIVEGSGFVISGDRVVTNAHVVAGVRNPKVLDVSGTHDGRVILFDKDTDLAVLKVSGLAGQPLSLNASEQPNGTQGVVLGYPGGGGFDAQPASVLDRFQALGRDIYGQDRTRRDVYSLQAKVIPGNSGGPVVNAEGEVIAVVFATSTSYNNIGYALTGVQVAPDIAASAGATQTVSTGNCSE